MSSEIVEEREGLEMASKLVRECIHEKGFLASPTEHDNYARIWSRDGVIIGLAAAMSGKPDLLDAFGKTLQTLAEHQGPHGEIPSNVGIDKAEVSYGGTAGRVDADLWFVIGVAEYWRATKDREFARSMMPVLEKLMFLLGAWEFNNRGFLYVPATGDWSDEYIHSGYILYDQLLYLQALRSYAQLQHRCFNNNDQSLIEKIALLQAMIRDNFWFGSKDKVPKNVYHEGLFEKGRTAADRCTQRFWLPFFSPHGYGYRFDGFANILASLLDVADETRRDKVDRYIEEQLTADQIKLIPAFSPVIKPVDKDWEELKVTFSYDFKNQPHEFHNGGLWQMLTGFYVADLARRGKQDIARRYLASIHRANSKEMDGQPWSFAEFINGKNFTAGGNRAQCWSASAALMGHYSLEGKAPFSVYDDDIFVQ